MQETEQLVVAFVQLSKQGGSKVTREDTFKQCQEAQTEVSTHQFHMPLHANIWQCASLSAEVSPVDPTVNDPAVLAAQPDHGAPRIGDPGKRMLGAALGVRHPGLGPRMVGGAGNGIPAMAGLVASE